MRETTKLVTIEIDGEEKQFQIKKMNAFDGSYLLKVVTEKALPLLEKATSITQEGVPDEVNLMKIAELLPGALASLGAEEMKRIMTLCLQTVYCLMPAGLEQVVDNRGEFCIPELEYDPASCLRLVYEVIAFNTSGFFGGSGLSSFLARRNGSQSTQ